MKKLPVSIYLLLLFILTGLNFALRYFNLPNYFFVIGFRFYGIIFLAGIFLFFYHGVEPFKQTLTSFSLKKTFKFVLFILLPPLLIIGVLFILKKIEIGDPDYFYELGLSSIVDSPIYFVWNFPQLFILFTLLQTVESSFRVKILPNFLLLVTFFSVEFFSFPKITINVFAIASYLILLLTMSLFINKSKNAFAFIFYFFTTIWFGLLLFGSKSEVLLQTFLAKTYTSWDGFFDINNKFVPFILPVYFLFSWFIILFSRKEKLKE